MASPSAAALTPAELRREGPCRLLARASAGRPARLMLLLLGVMGVVAAAGGCGEDGTAVTAATAPSPSLDGRHAYAAMARPIPGPPPGPPEWQLPAHLRATEVTSYRVGGDDGPPAYLVVAATETCLLAKGDDGTGGACTETVESNGVVALGQIRGDGRYLLSAVVPDDVTAVEFGTHSVAPVNNLVRLPLPFGTTTVTFRSTLGNSTLTYTARPV